MAPDEDTSFTYLTLVGTVAGVFADSQGVILLSLALAAALKALPSLYARDRGDSGPGSILIRAEDWVMFLAAAVGYILTAGTGNPNFAIAGLAVAAVGKSSPSLYRHRRYGSDREHDYSPTADLVMLTISLVSVALTVVTMNPSWATYGIVFAFIGKGLSKSQRRQGEAASASAPATKAEPPVAIWSSRA